MSVSPGPFPFLPLPRPSRLPSKNNAIHRRRLSRLLTRAIVGASSCEIRVGRQVEIMGQLPRDRRKDQLHMFMRPLSSATEKTQSNHSRPQNFRTQGRHRATRKVSCAGGVGNASPLATKPGYLEATGNEEDYIVHAFIISSRMPPITCLMALGRPSIVSCDLLQQPFRSETRAVGNPRQATV